MTGAALAVKRKPSEIATAPAPATRRKPAGTPRYLRASSLALGGLHDKEEHEAESASRTITAGGVHRVTDPGGDGRIRRTIAPPVTDPAAAGRIRRSPAGRVEDPGGHLRRRPGDGRPAASHAASLVGQARGAPARPLAPAMQARLEHGLGAKLDGVQVHSGSAAGAAAAAIGARAYTEGSRITLGRGESEHDVALMAHEATHVVQNHGTTGPVRRLGLDDVLDYLADKANLIPGYRMFTIVLGVNPINQAPVARTTANVLRAIVDFLPGGDLIVQALDRYGVFDKAGAWIDAQIDNLGITAGSIIHAVTEFIHSLGISDVLSPGDVWERAKRIFTDPIDRIIGFVKSVGGAVLDLIRDAVLKPIAGLAAGTKGWDLAIAILGHNPITGEPVPRTADTLIGGFMKLIDKEEVWANAKRAHAGERLWAWFQGALAQLVGFVERIPQLFLDALHAFEIADLLDLPGAFGRVVRLFGNFVGDFVTWAGETVWHLLEIIFDVVSPGALVYIKKTGAALRSIFADPLPFVHNLGRAAKLGFSNFAGNFGTHLKAGLIDWLTGSLPGIYIPKAFELGEIAHFVMSVLGITWQNVRGKLVKAVGETAVKAMETGFDLVMTLVTKGPAAAWEQIKGELGNLQDMVLNGIKDFVIDAVITKGIPKLIAMFIPGAGFVSAILSIYDMVMVFVHKISRIIAVVTGFIDSIVAIAGGAIDAAAARVEGALANVLALAINFLAGFGGLSNVAEKIMGVIGRIVALIDRGLNKLVDLIVAGARKLGRFVAQAGVPNDPNERLRLAAQAATTAARAMAGGVTRPLLAPVFAALKLRYALTAIEAYEKTGTWWVRVSINPTLDANLGVGLILGPDGKAPLADYQYRESSARIPDGPVFAPLAGKLNQAVAVFTLWANLGTSPVAQSMLRQLGMARDEAQALAEDQAHGTPAPTLAPRKLALAARLQQIQALDPGYELVSIGALAITLLNVHKQMAVVDVTPYTMLDPSLRPEYEDQLADQQNGVNAMTAEQWFRNRTIYTVNKRSKAGTRQQRVFQTRSGRPPGTAAPHNPDQGFGGYQDPTGAPIALAVNNHIGSQLPGRVATVTAAVQALSGPARLITQMNIRLRVA